MALMTALLEHEADKSYKDHYFRKYLLGTVRS